MTTIIKHEELVRKALLFMDERLREQPGSEIHALLDEAGSRFNLSPNDSQALCHLFQQAEAARTGNPE